MPLTDARCRSLKAKSKAYKASDGGSLYLYITPSEKKYWRMNYRYGDKSKTLAIGVYPQISLKEARIKRDAAKALIADGKDPSYEKQQHRVRQKIDASNQFETIASEWLETHRQRISKKHCQLLERILKEDINPIIGKTLIQKITAPDLLFALRQIEERGALEVARKARQCCGQIFRYAIATGKAERDIAADLKGALKTRKVQHHSYLQEDELAEFFHRLQSYHGKELTAWALELIVLTFVRTGELRFARWEEFDLDKKLWRIPAERMKNNKPHIVPLSAQALLIIKQVHQLTGKYSYVFTNLYKPNIPLGENALLSTMYRMGYHGRATVHGFRATASTILNEQGFAPDIIERQLAHTENNQVRAAYNHAQYLKERAEMMQWYADHLDSLK